MMYGTIAILKVKDGQAGALSASMDRWHAERGDKVKGFLATSVHQNENNPSEYILSVVFASKEDYQANANDPEQDKWFHEMMTYLEKEPHWMDGEVVSYKHS
jgi:quinol monooxygenase YgiN